MRLFKYILLAVVVICSASPWAAETPMYEYSDFNCYALEASGSNDCKGKYDRGSPEDVMSAYVKDQSCYRYTCYLGPITQQKTYGTKSAIIFYKNEEGRELFGGGTSAAGACDNTLQWYKLGNPQPGMACQRLICPLGQFLGMKSGRCRTSCGLNQYLQNGYYPGYCKDKKESLDDIDPDAGRPNACAGQPSSGNPINTATGSKYQYEADLPWGPGLVFGRSYNSLDALKRVDRGLGIGWSAHALPRIEAVYLSPAAMNLPIPSDMDPDWTWPKSSDTTPRLVYYRLVRPDGASVAFGPDGQIRDASNKFHLLITITAAGFTVQDDQSIETYSSDGLITQRREIGDNTLRYTYLGGVLSQISDAGNRSIGFTYDATVPNRIIAVTRQDGVKVSYQYDTLNRLTQVTRADGNTRRYVYEMNSTSALPLYFLLTGIVDENGQRFATWTYNSQGQALSSEHAGGVDKYTLSYYVLDAVAGTYRTLERNPLGAYNDYQFRKLGRRVLLSSHLKPASTGCLKGTNSLTYDAGGNITSRTDFNGNVTQYSYDAARNLEISRTQAFGTPIERTTSTSWHPQFSLPIRITEPGRLTEMSYDERGNLTSRKETDTQIQEARTWLYAYDSADRITSQTDPAQRTTQFYYNDKGDLERVTRPGNLVTQYQNHNALGQPGRIVDPAGVVTLLSYDVYGRVLSITVGDEATTYQYSPVGQLIKVDLPGGKTMRYSYDAAQRLIGINDNRGNSIKYTLDVMGNRIKEEIADSAGSLAALIQDVERGLQLARATPTSRMGG